MKDLFSTLKKSVISSSDSDEEGKYNFYISGAKLKKINKFNLTKKALLLPTGGSYMVHYPTIIPCAYSTDVLPVIAKRNISLKFAFYLLSHNKDYFNKNYFWGSGLKHLQRNSFLNSEIITTSLIEQQQIVEYLDEQCSKIDKKKELINKKVELLKEYKQSLIYEAVTGKLLLENNMKNLHIEILKKYNNPTIGLNSENMAKEFNLSVNEIEETINDLIDKGFLENKELKSKALGSNQYSRNIIAISYSGKNYLNKINQP